MKILLVVLQVLCGFAANAKAIHDKNAAVVPTEQNSLQFLSASFPNDQAENVHNLSVHQTVSFNRDQRFAATGSAGFVFTAVPATYLHRTAIPSAEELCLPVSRLLLFPKHYFW